MAEIRQRNEWDHTAAILALTEVVNAGKRTRYSPGKWNPYRVDETAGKRERPGMAIMSDTIGALAIFVPKGRRKKRTPKRESNRTLQKPKR